MADPSTALRFGPAAGPVIRTPPGYGYGFTRQNGSHDLRVSVVEF